VPDNFDRASARRHMEFIISEFGYAVGPYGEINATQLAEATADEMNHPEWLDDDQHEIWDVAVECAESMEKR